MIEERTGDLFGSGAEALVNPVNCVGVMGKGLALAFKRRFPDNFARYQRACQAQQVRPGKMFVVQRPLGAYPRFIINFPTKRDWRDASRLDDVALGLSDLVAVVRDNAISSVAVPALGCGLGGLDWYTVRQEILVAFEPLARVRVFLYAPQDAAKETV